MKKIIYGIVLAGMLSSCSMLANSKPTPTETQTPTKQVTSSPTTEIPTETEVLKLYQKSKPKEWGENITGVVKTLPTKDKVIALTFDACGGNHGSGVDNDIIRYLMEEKIPATLFINARWIDANPKIFAELAKNPLFEIENHGTEHRPLSVTGRSIYGINGTKDITNVYHEVNENAQKIKKLTGKSPAFFRSGTAYYDDVAVKIASDLGEIPVNFDIIGDAGATYHAGQVDYAMQQAKPGSIVILHMNQPNGDTAEGIKRSIPKLLKKGYRFVKLQDYLSSK
ncbi:polysaccharide deacetylase family protein [Shimazuella kribbensis]|uniref:polysaccharide deacetylase family protein n=1 Tax=Shimazuella kribbensis TaxID=139808 RepID=UPI00041D86FC|nr:polysaccharide deacetylase family protein [Shimazuella kribbensis]